MIKTAKQFRAARHNLGWSVAQTAEYCRVNDRTVRRWEHGRDGSIHDRDPSPPACKLMELALEAQGAANVRG